MGLSASSAGPLPRAANTQPRLPILRAQAAAGSAQPSAWTNSQHCSSVPAALSLGLPAFGVALHRGWTARPSQRRAACVARTAKRRWKPQRPSMAELAAQMRAEKERKELERLAAAMVDQEPVQESGFAVGRVVGGAERHGEVLVEIVADGELDAAEEEAFMQNPLPALTSSMSSAGPIICQISRGRRGPKENPIVGDFVRLEWGKGVGEAEAFVCDVLPRRTTLLRRHPAIAAKPQILCANLDLAVLVVSVEPNFSEGMVDRVLVSTHAQGLGAAIVLNKIDLVPEGSPERAEIDARLSIYERIGYPVLRTSVISGEGIPKLRELLGGHISILIGNSGVGKSHLLNELGQGEIAATVGEISERLKLGRHTTTTSTLHRLPGDGEEALLIDSPGARRFSIWDVESAELKDHFVEFLPYAGQCRFNNCNHAQEPGCAVVAAVEAGEIQEERYRSYNKIREDLLIGREGAMMHSSKLST